MNTDGNTKFSKKYKIHQQIQNTDRQGGRIVCLSIRGNKKILNTDRDTKYKKQTDESLFWFER